MSLSIRSLFALESGFCGLCGTILPLTSEVEAIKCVSCNKKYGPEAYGLMKCSYTLHFNSPDNYKAGIEANSNVEDPIIERKCPKCGNNKMSYTTLQLRSADEGQTVFYQCTKCKFRENENS